jgi:hypothetical protein
MKKKVVLRGLLGLPIGIAFGYVITIVLSLFFSNGSYHPVVPALIDAVGNEINAVVFQAILCGVLGVSFASSSIIWEIEHWSIAKQTGVYFLVISVVMLPIAYFAHWMEHSLLGFILYFSIFVVIFMLMWLIQYAIWKRAVTDIDKKVK